MGTLYLVATPIGNLEDISARALRILQEVQLIAAEDSRETRKLLDRYHIHTPMLSYHDHSPASHLERILDTLQHADVALVSEAGTPGLNDPGYALVNAALRLGHTVTPIPGPSAPIAALVASGLPAHHFLYLGFLPRKSSERHKLLSSVSALPFTLILLETPKRLLSSLEVMLQVLGNRRIAIARELTKVHEEIFRGTLKQAIQHYSAQLPRGEFTLVVEAASTQPFLRWEEHQLAEAIREGLRTGKATRTLASELAELSGWIKRDVYQMITNIKTHQELENWKDDYEPG